MISPSQENATHLRQTKVTVWKENIQTEKINPERFGDQRRQSNSEQTSPGSGMDNLLSHIESRVPPPLLWEHLFTQEKYQN